MASDDLQFTYLFAEISEVWEKLQQPIRSSSRLRYTALSVSPSYVALGSSTGALYVFDQATLRLLHHLPGDKEGAIVNLKFAPDGNVIANATGEGTIVVTELNINRRAASRRMKVITDQRGSTVTDMVWNEAGTQLYTGDDRGRVLRVSISLSKAKDILQPPNEFIMRDGLSVVQLCMWDVYLLVSTLTRTWLCDTNRREYYPIGKQERNGKFGSCFYARDDEVRVLCARPRSRVWEATLHAQVVNTHQMKQRLSAPSLPVVRMRDEPLHLTGDKNDDMKANVVNFYSFYPFREKYIFTWSDEGIYVFDPSRPHSLIWSAVQDISNVEVGLDDIFFLDSNCHVKRITMVTPDHLSSELFSHSLFDQCAEVCLNYSFYIALEKSRSLVSKDLLETLTSKINDDLIVARLRELICNLELEDANEQWSGSKIVSLDANASERIEVTEEPLMMTDMDSSAAAVDGIVALVGRTARIVSDDELSLNEETAKALHNSSSVEHKVSFAKDLCEERGLKGKDVIICANDVAKRCFDEMSLGTEEESAPLETDSEENIVDNAKIPQTMEAGCSQLRTGTNSESNLSNIYFRKCSESESDPVIGIAITQGEETRAVQSKPIDIRVDEYAESEDRMQVWLNSTSPAALGIQKLVEDVGSFSETEALSRMAMSDTAGAGAHSDAASPRTNRRKNIAIRKSRVAVVEFGEPVGNKNVKGNIVAYSEKPVKSKKKSDDDVGTENAPNFAKCRSISTGDMKKLPVRLPDKDGNPVLLLARNADEYVLRHRDSFSLSDSGRPDHVSVRTDTPVSQKMDESEDYDENVVPVPLHTSGEPADPTLRKLKQFSQKVRSNSQVFFKNLKENIKEKTLDSFRENFTLDPMNNYFYPENLSNAVTVPEKSDVKKEDESKVDDKQKEDASLMVLNRLRESTLVASALIFDGTRDDSVSRVKIALENWLGVLNESMASIMNRSINASSKIDARRSQNVTAVGDGASKKEYKVTPLSDDSSSEDLESSAEHDLSLQRFLSIDSNQKTVILVKDPFGLSDSLRQQIAELLILCVRTKVLDGVDQVSETLQTLHHEIGAEKLDQLNKDEEVKESRIDALSDNGTKSSIQEDNFNLPQIGPDFARLVWLTSSADSTNENENGSHGNGTTPPDVLTIRRENSVIDREATESAADRDPDWDSEFHVRYGPLGEYTTHLVQFMRCYFYLFDTVKLRSYIHELEISERYRVWISYMACLKALSVEEPLSAVLAKTDLRSLKDEDLRSDLLRSRADLAHLDSLVHMDLVKTVESLCIALSERIRPLDVLYLVWSTGLSSEAFLQYMDQLWRKANDSEVLMKTLCSDEELKECWLQVLLAAANVPSNDVKCICGMPKPFTHIHDWPARSLIDNVLQYGTAPSRLLVELLWQRGLWSPWLQYGRSSSNELLVIGVVVQLGDIALLDVVLNGSTKSPEFLAMIVHAKSDQTDDAMNEPANWKCIECQRQFNLDPEDHYGPFSVPPHRIMIWERLAQILVDQFGIETCSPLFRRRAPLHIVNSFVPKELREQADEIVEFSMDMNKTLGEETQNWISASMDTGVKGQSTDRTFIPVGKTRGGPDAWTSMDSFVDFWAPKPSFVACTPMEKQPSSGSADSDVGAPVAKAEDFEASSESSATPESPRFPRKRILTHRTRRPPPDYPDDSTWEILPDKRTPPRRSTKKTIEKKLQEWELIPDKLILRKEMDLAPRQRKRSIEAVFSGKLKGLIGLELKAANARERSIAEKMVEMQPANSWSKNSRDQFHAIHGRKLQRKKSSEAKLVSSSSPCVICGNPLLDVVGGKDPNVSIFPCLHGYHRACILTDDHCIKCFLEEQRKMIEGR